MLARRQSRAARIADANRNSISGTEYFSSGVRSALTPSMQQASATAGPVGAGCAAMNLRSSGRVRLVARRLPVTRTDEGTGTVGAELACVREIGSSRELLQQSIRARRVGGDAECDRQVVEQDASDVEIDRVLVSGQQLAFEDLERRVELARRDVALGEFTVVEDRRVDRASSRWLNSSRGPLGCCARQAMQR
jgi:hypothetical protein